MAQTTADPNGQFEPTRRAGVDRLDAFLPRAGREYAASRNYDFGPENRTNVSLLSPYIRHRLVTEDEVLSAVLAEHGSDRAAKFVDEVFWRAYFKGWLEHRPSVWARYRDDVSDLVASLETDGDLAARYEAAIAGRTGIDCFDSWAQELVVNGYLHNHARMWFASIWVFTLKLPWQLGADFFYRNLLDGDPASNTLGWRWVSGLHTKGKTYLARVSNIATYTDGRFNPDKQLAATAPPLEEPHEHPVRTVREPTIPDDVGRCGLLVTEEDGSPSSLDLPAKPVHILGAVVTDLRSPLAVGKPAKTFALGAVADAVDRARSEFDVPGEMAPTEDWGPAIARWAAENDLDAVITAYAPVGPVAEALDAARHHLSKTPVAFFEVKRQYDALCWPHASKGYYKLKARIPELLAEIDPGERTPARARAAS